MLDTDNVAVINVAMPCMSIVRSLFAIGVPLDLLEIECENESKIDCSCLKLLMSGPICRAANFNFEFSFIRRSFAVHSPFIRIATLAHRK